MTDHDIWNDELRADEEDKQGKCAACGRWSIDGGNVCAACDAVMCFSCNDAEALPGTDLCGGCHGV